MFSAEAPSNFIRKVGKHNLGTPTMRLFPTHNLSFPHPSKPTTPNTKSLKKTAPSFFYYQGITIKKSFTILRINTKHSNQSRPYIHLHVKLTKHSKSYAKGQKHLSK